MNAVGIMLLKEKKKMSMKIRRKSFHRLSINNGREQHRVEFVDVFFLLFFTSYATQLWGKFKKKIFQRCMRIKVVV